MKRLLVYSHDTYGLGNIRRMLAICEHICSVHKDISILIVTGSPMLHAFRLSPNIDYVKLPCLARTSSGDYEVKALGVDFETTLAMREQMLLGVMESFEPDLVLVDKKPFGVGEELRPALELARCRPNPPGLVLVLRDILDDPATTQRIWNKNLYFDAIECFFDSVLVLGSAEIFDVTEAYNFPPRAASRVQFCGYIGRPDAAATVSETKASLGLNPDLPMVLVTPGGGQDGVELADCYVQALTTGGLDGCVSLLVTGPEMDAHDRERLVNSASETNNLTVLGFSDDMSSLIAAADVVVSMAGYNTVCEVLSARQRSILVPRMHPVREQLIRAELLDRLGLAQLIHPEALTPPLLVEGIHKALSADGLPPSNIDLGGLDRVEKHLAGLLGDD